MYRDRRKHTNLMDSSGSQATEAERGKIHLCSVLSRMNLTDPAERCAFLYIPCTQVSADTNRELEDATGHHRVRRAKGHRFPE